MGSVLLCCIALGSIALWYTAPCSTAKGMMQSGAERGGNGGGVAAVARCRVVLGSVLLCSAALHGAVLHCVEQHEQHCIVLCCAVLHWAALHCAALCCAVLLCVALGSIALCRVALCCIALCCSALGSIALWYTAPCSTAKGMMQSGAEKGWEWGGRCSCCAVLRGVGKRAAVLCCIARCCAALR